MGLVKKIVAWGCLSWAALLVIFMVVIAFDPEESPQEKREIGLGLLILGAPPAVVGVGLLANLRSNNQKRLEEQQEAQEERLRRIVYELAAANQGQVTSFRFAQVAQLPAAEAKAYLDQCAQDFGAAYDFTDTGEIIYRFPT
ncbi:MAG: hypothetical protein O2890_12855 [Cyanobacteria bacterium]|nr:hypothetical protein [Cyanobacteriota bacterium]MDA0867279.1 hypothetical protein [Cyanobacteriota bacterium]